MKKKVLIKGAGDLATGIACRLHNCGFRIVMTETAVPTTVRRTVAFSRAVYENRAQVEGIEGVLCRDLPEIEKTLAQEKIAVIVATTTGDRPNTVVTQSGKAESAAGAWVIPMPSAAASPTMDMFR